MQRYLPYILQEVAKRNLPAELALLPVIESALDPYAFSPYGASGLWQFMRPTAKQYGLQMNSYYDGRRDVIASTQAALDFLEDLHRRFDDWSLALAAYNAGGGTVSKAIRKGRTKDFFALRSPERQPTCLGCWRFLPLSLIRKHSAWSYRCCEHQPVAGGFVAFAIRCSRRSRCLALDVSLIYEFNSLCAAPSGRVRALAANPAQ